MNIPRMTRRDRGKGLRDEDEDEEEVASSRPWSTETIGATSRKAGCKNAHANDTEAVPAPMLQQQGPLRSQQGTSKDPLLTSNDVRRLLSKTPCFIPAPRKISGTAVADDCYKFGYSLVKAFDRFVRKDNIWVARDTAADFGFVQWTPKQFPFPRGYYKDFVTRFFQTPLDLNHPGSLWRDNWDKCPDLPQFITMFSEHVMTNVEVINRGTASRSNLSKNEKELLNKLKEYQIGFNISDKNFGPVLYSSTNTFNNADSIYTMIRHIRSSRAIKKHNS
jgi:hypothetical protein